MNAARDREFTAFVAREGEALLHCAYLCHGKVDSARLAVELALARAYASWGRSPTPRLDALRFVSSAGSARPFLPWRSTRRLHLVDAAPSRPTPTPTLVRELEGISNEARRALVLSLVGGLTAAQISVDGGAGAPEVQRRLNLAQEEMETRRAVYGSPGTLTEALQRAVPASLSARKYEPDSDRAHGRYLIRARRRRVLALTAAALAAVVLAVQGVGVLRPKADASNERPAPVASIISPSAPTFVPLPPAGGESCDTTSVVCRQGITQLWRFAMHQVVLEYLDPERSYFADADVFYAVPDLNEYDLHAGLWAGDGGALVVKMTGDSGAGTQLFLQIATSPDFSAQCGYWTGHSCISQRFLDGNQYDLTESSSAAEGVEVQFAPDGEVITLVARDSEGGKALPVDRGQLVELIQDPRLRLPPI